jgi:hypothetical protein
MMKIAVFLILGLLILATFRFVLASPEEYSLVWWTVDGGGALSQGGAYAVHGTIGQPDASSAMQGGVYSMFGGFWKEAVSLAGGFRVFLPLTVK